MSGPKAIVVLQARMGSRRLPGKVLAPIDGRSVLARCIERLRASGAGELVVATTDRPEDEEVAVEARRCGAAVFRGPSEDVLKRFLLVADLMHAQLLVRATADNPAVDVEAPARVLRCLAAEEADHVVEPSLPLGAAVEAVRVAALRRAGSETVEAYDREHVTPYVRSPANGFRTIAPDPPPHLRRPDLRFTVDTAEDLEYMRRVFASLGTRGGPAALADIIAAADDIGRRETTR